jgi:hypothetical protein
MMAQNDYSDDDVEHDEANYRGDPLDNKDEIETEINDCNETIGLFGIVGNTGKHLVKLLLDAGYSVKALVGEKDVVEVEHDQLELVVGGLDDVDLLEHVIAGASYTICLLGDCYPKKDYTVGILFEFIKRIYPLMKENNTQVFIYQVCGDVNFVINSKLSVVVHRLISQRPLQYLSTLKATCLGCLNS